MSSRHRFKIEKLVRNRTLERLAAADVTASSQTLSAEEYPVHIKKKLIEESHEVASASTPEELCSELADVLEAVRAIAQATKIPFDDVEKKRLEKLESRGGFDKRIYLNYIEMDENNSKYQYHKNKPQEYPEIEISGEEA